MTRPNIVRADTLDLQDQDNPTAAEHHKQTSANGLAPHQRAEVDHVIQERHSEEEALAEAWNITSNIADEPDAIDKAQQDHEDGTQQNGEDSGNSETEGDDDMMDRISSSPSIDDGVYTIPSSPPSITAPVRSPQQRTIWPKRTSSLSPSPRNTPTPTRETFNQSPLSSPATSSPFLQTPQHLPLHVRRTGGRIPTLQREGSSDLLSSSPFDDSPERLPMIRVESPQERFSLQSLSKCHHGRGRYMLDLVPEEDEEEEDLEADEGYFDGGRTPRPRSRNDAFASATGEAASLVLENESDRSVIVHDVQSPESRTDDFLRPRAVTHDLDDIVKRQLEQSPSFSSIQSVDISDIILPVDDPLLDKPLPASPTSSSESWETDSDHDLDDEDEHDDDTDALFLDLDDRFIDSGWGGECLRDTEDIDFEFVYALHTFVATVEGQANATKGDTMVLLDDSNSYWWLVRVVKDNSIGYLPAEHIETPTERLARLNKHRNIDLSATMLSDNAEKSRNPLKKAMKRRNAKTVQFAAPTYVEASDNEYSSEEEDGGMVEPYAGIVEAEKTQQETTEPEGEARASSEARTSHEDSHRLSTSSRDSFDREQAATIAQGTDEPELSPKLVDKTEAAPLKSRKGTPRNTDSFLKDDSIETRKITLTPGILREDGSTKSASSESARNTSMESLTKVTSPPEQTAKKEVKKEKEKKEKKQGMLSGLFKSKKKDKKSKEEVVESDAEKPSNEFSRDSPRGSPAPSGRSSPSQQTGGPTQVSPGLTVDTRRSEAQGKQQSQRSKLTKPSPSAPSPSRSPAREDKPAQQQPATSQDETRSTSQQQQQTQDQQKSGEFIAELEGSEAAYEMAGAEDIASQTAQTQAPPPQQQKEGPLSPLTNMLKGSSDPKPTKAKRSKQRVELDDFDSPAEDESPNPFKEQEERARKLSGEDGGALDESPVEVSASHNAFMHGTDSIHIPMPGQFEEETPEGSDDEEQEAKGKGREVGKDDDESARSSSPSLIERPSSSADDEAPPSGLTRNASGEATSDDATPTGPRSPSAAEKTTQPPTTSSSPPARNLSVDSTTNTKNQHTPTTSSSSPNTVPETDPEPDTFSPAALHTWLTSPDSTKEIHDMMLLIHDTSGVVPVGAEHAVMKGLWVQERESVGRMMGELDGLLGGFLERRGGGGGSGGKGIKA